MVFKGDTRSFHHSSYIYTYIYIHTCIFPNIPSKASMGIDPSEAFDSPARTKALKDVTILS